MLQAIPSSGIYQQWSFSHASCKFLLSKCSPLFWSGFGSSTDWWLLCLVTERTVVSPPPPPPPLSLSPSPMVRLTAGDNWLFRPRPRINYPTTDSNERRAHLVPEMDRDSCFSWISLFVCNVIPFRVGS